LSGYLYYYHSKNGREAKGNRRIKIQVIKGGKFGEKRLAMGREWGIILGLYCYENWHAGM
jgi:hypothetical protein